MYIPSAYYKWIVDKIKLKASINYSDDATWGPVIPCADVDKIDDLHVVLGGLALEIGSKDYTI